MTTTITDNSPQNLQKAAELLQKGEIVALPTETVYGLACNALDPNAVAKVFAAKSRPQDNPLIVHVSGLSMARDCGLEIPPLAETLAQRFWSGPLTMLFKKNNGVVQKIPAVISRGLDTVAVRVPANETFMKIITRCGFPIAAPSANLSGSPSPTSAEHVYSDLNGKIPLIIDGGRCEIGIESTVIALNNNNIRILRPGAVTPEMLSEFAEVTVDDIVYHKAEKHSLETSSVPSPGTAYKHYSPKAEVIAVKTQSEQAFNDYVNRNGESYSIANPQADTLFAKFREFDQSGAERIYVNLPEPTGIGLALYNRIIRAAEFNIICL